MIVFDGRGGGLGGYFAAAVADAGIAARSLESRLEDRATADELASLRADDGPVCLVQLAARASVAACERDPDDARRINVDGVVERVAQFVRWAHGAKREASVVYVSTGHVYAAQPVGTRCKETDPVSPRSAYATTKAAAEEQLASLCRSLDVRLVIARVFGLVAPVQPPSYVLPNLLARARSGDVHAVPGARCVRDYLDARDVVRLLLALVPRAGRPADTLTVNVCSGEGIEIRRMLDVVLARIGGERAAELRASIGDAQGRADDVPWLVGDPTLLSSLVGAPRTIALERTIDDALRLRRENA